MIESSEDGTYNISHELHSIVYILLFTILLLLLEKREDSHFCRFISRNGYY